MSRLIALCFAMATCWPALSAAQVSATPATPDPDRWGVSVSVVPKFQMSGGGNAIDKLAEVMFNRGDEGLDVSGGDFRIGVVRGRRLGGEWGVSYVRRSFSEDSTQGAIETMCSPQSFNNVTLCFTSGTEYVYNDQIKLDGIEVNRLFVISTIKNVVQIGLDAAGGVGWMKGVAIERNVSSGGGFNNPPPGSTITLPTTVTETEVPAAELMTIDPALIGRVELAVGAILGPNVKVRASGGFNVPGTHVFSITGSVFF